MTDMLDIVRQRYTTKHYDETKRISDEDFAKLAEVLRLSPSSVNSQPWHWFVADTDEAKAKILPAILDFNRERVTKASHVVVFAVHEDLTDDYLKALLAQEVADGRFNLHSESEQKPRGIRPFKPLGLFSDARDMGNRLLKASKTFTEDTIPPFPLKCGH